MKTFKLDNCCNPIEIKPICPCVDIVPYGEFNTLEVNEIQANNDIIESSVTQKFNYECCDDTQGFEFIEAINRTSEFTIGNATHNGSVMTIFYTYNSNASLGLYESEIKFKVCNEEYSQTIVLNIEPGEPCEPTVPSTQPEPIVIEFEIPDPIPTPIQPLQIDLGEFEFNCCDDDLDEIIQLTEITDLLDKVDGEGPFDLLFPSNNSNDYPINLNNTTSNILYLIPNYSNISFGVIYIYQIKYKLCNTNYTQLIQIQAS